MNINLRNSEPQFAASVCTEGYNGRGSACVVGLTLHADSTAPCNKGVTRKLFYTKASGRLTHFTSLYIVQPNGIVSLLDCTHKNRMLFMTVCHELCTRFCFGRTHVYSVEAEENVWG